MPAEQQAGDKPILELGPFLGLNTTKSPFYYEQGVGAVVSNVDISTFPGQFTTAKGRKLISNITLRTGYIMLCAVPFTTFVGCEQNDGTIGERCLLVYSAFNPTTGDSHGGWYDLGNNHTGHIGGMQPFTQAVQFGDGLYTNGGDRVIFTIDGTLAKDEWQIQVDPRLTYEATGAAAPGTGPGGTFQYAYTRRRAASWDTQGGPKGIQAHWHGSVTCAANGFLSFTLVIGSSTYTTAQIQFTRSKKNGQYQESIAELSTAVAQQIVATINSDPNISLLITAYAGQDSNGTQPSPDVNCYANQYGSVGNSYNAFFTITNTGNGNSASPSGPPDGFSGGQDKGAGQETTLSPDLATYQESSPVYTPQFPVPNDNAHIPAFVIPQHMSAADLISGSTRTNGQWYGALYRTSILNPTPVFVDYLINLQQGMTSGPGSVPCFLDPYTDTQIQNNVILTPHNDAPPFVGQVYPGPQIIQSTPNASNGGPPSYYEQLRQKQSFTYANPGTIAKHQTRMFVLTLYPTMPVRYKKDNRYRNKVQLQPQLWFSDFGIPWAYDDVQQLLLVNSEDCPGNYQIDNTDQAPWSPSAQLNDIPVGMASTGSILILFKRRSCYVLFGDSPAEFQQGLREAFDIGAVAQNSIVAKEGGVFWLSDEPLGFYFFNGNSPSYISQDIWQSLVALRDAGELPLCCSQYDGEGHILYASWPPSENSNSPAYETGVTFCYSTTEQKWFTLPYGSTVLFRGPLNQSAVGIAQQTDVKNNIWTLSYLRAAYQDLGADVTGVWQTGVSVGTRRGVNKIFKNIVLMAPSQPADATVQLFVDGVTQPDWQWTWNLDAINNANATDVPWARVADLPPDVQGFSAYGVLTVTNRSTTNEASVFAVDIIYEEKGGLQSTASFDGAFNNAAP